jgi:membrane protease YdiL (CAAX protease family)
VFGAAHFQILQFPALFVVGAVTAVLLDRTKRLAPSVWTHVGFNATTVVALVLL